MSADALAEKIGNVDERIVNYAKTCKNGEMTTQGFKTSLEGMTFSAKAGQVALKGLAIAGNMLAAWAISKAISLAVKGIDNLIHASENARESMNDAFSEYESAKSEVESLNDELQTTNDRIDELNAKQNLSFVEQEELRNLQETNKELKVKIDLLEKEAALKKKDSAVSAVKSVETSFGEEGISQDNINYKISNYRQSRLEGNNHPETFLMNKDDLEDNITALKIYNELLDEAYNTKDQENIEEYTDILGDLKDSMTDNLLLLYEQRDSMEDYYNYISKQDSSTWTTDDKNVVAQYERILKDIDYINQALSPEKYVDEKISGILAKVDFQDTAKQLENLGKNGSLSVDTLSSRFPDLIAYLEQAGVSAEELYQYIMALSNPDAINYDEVKKQLLEGMHIRGGEVRSAKEEAIYNEAESLGLFEKESLEAYLTVRTKFTDNQTTEWTPKDWADYIQKEINGELDSDEMSVLNIRDYLNQEDLKDVKDELFNLFKTGELNEDSINSIREFRDMLTATGLSAKDAVNEIEQFFEASNETIDLSDWKTQLNEARNAINSLKTIKGEIGSGYSDSSINTIISDYPQLLAYLDDESSMLEAVNNLLDEQSLKAEIAANKMLEFNPNIYKEVISQVYSDLEQSNSSLIQTLATGYGIDLNNFSSLAQAKEEIDKQLLQTLMEMWGEYYGIVVDSVTGLASVTQNLPDFYQNEEAQNQLATYNQIITKLNATADKFNNGLDFGSLGDGASKAGGDAGDAYVDEFEKALEKLQSLRDQGVISEKDYLDQLRVNITALYRSNTIYKK